ncbi:hypothetical protein B0H10DRAFT_662661 [Mycena sp. CBHHK59/15]|nr:hypothetical protein B0H10DRAFT_662661 [Mycena sp. CBHHK59/15]
MGDLNFLLLAVLFCVFHSVIGQILVATPSNTEECIPVLIVWTGGTAPYSIVKFWRVAPAPLPWPTTYKAQPSHGRWISLLGLLCQSKSRTALG